MAKTILKIPKAMLKFAVKHGAEQDPVSKKWFIVGDVPLPLISFVPKEVRRAVPEQGPSCKICGSDMKKRFSGKDGSAFWGCMRYPACMGTAQWEYGVAKKALGIFASPSGLCADVVSNSGSGEEKRRKELLHLRRTAVVELAVKKLGSVGAAERWLGASLVSLQGGKPNQLLGTIEGCDRVAELLEILFPNFPLE